MSVDKDKSDPQPDAEDRPAVVPAQDLPAAKPAAAQLPTSQVPAAPEGEDKPKASDTVPAAAEAVPASAGASTDKPSASAEPVPVPPDPASPGDLFVVGRWRELTAPDSAWFARTTDVGHRQRLAELIALAKANGAGGVRAESITELLVETKDAFAHADLFVSARFPELAAEIKGLSTTGSSFVPGSAGLASATACLGRLEGPEYVEELASALVVEAAAAEKNLASLRPLGKLVELLDSELSFGGHSRTWRAGVAAAVADRVAAGETLADALPQTLVAQHANLTREFVVMVPIHTAPEGDDESEAPSWSIDSATAAEIVLDWPAEGRPAAQQLIATAHRIAVFDAIETVDAEAALRRADDMLRRRANVWRLLGNALVEPDQAVVCDSLARQTTIRALPSQPLDLAPVGLDGWVEDETPSGALHDALDQLAEARTARPAAAFVDLWTAAEALYGGGVNDRGYRAGLVMAGMAEYMYIQDSIVWLARRADDAGAGGVPDGGEVRWLLEAMGEKGGPSRIEKALVDSGDLVGWSRFKRMTNWDDGWGLRSELEELSRRLASVTNRAYLYRNFAVHRADESLPGLDALLPSFAGLVQVSIGLSWRQASGLHDVLMDAKTAALTVRAVADDFGQKRAAAPGGLDPVLGTN